MNLNKRKFPDIMPCKKCFHSFEDHVVPFPPIWESFCSVDVSEFPNDITAYNTEFCDCHKFIPDNLKYLEKKYKEKERKKND